MLTYVVFVDLIESSDKIITVGNLCHPYTPNHRKSSDKIISVGNLCHPYTPKTLYRILRRKSSDKIIAMESVTHTVRRLCLPMSSFFVIIRLLWLSGLCRVFGQNHNDGKFVSPIQSGGFGQKIVRMVTIEQNIGHYVVFFCYHTIITAVRSLQI